MLKCYLSNTASEGIVICDEYSRLHANARVKHERWQHVLRIAAGILRQGEAPLLENPDVQCQDMQVPHELPAIPQEIHASA